MGIDAWQMEEESNQASIFMVRHLHSIRARRARISVANQNFHESAAIPEQKLSVVHWLQLLLLFPWGISAQGAVTVSLNNSQAVDNALTFGGIQHYFFENLHISGIYLHHFQHFESRPHSQLKLIVSGFGRLQITDGSFATSGYRRQRWQYPDYLLDDHCLFSASTPAELPRPCPTFAGFCFYLFE